MKRHTHHTDDEMTEEQMEALRRLILANARLFQAIDSAARAMQALASVRPPSSLFVAQFQRAAERRAFQIRQSQHPERS